MLRQLWIDARVRLDALFGRRRLYERAQEELAFHLEMREQRLREAGLPPEEARVRARREVGNASQFTEQSLGAWRYGFMDTLTQDIRYGLRTFARNPGFTATALLSIALGIGANTAIFSVFDALIFRPLPVAKPEELVLATRRMGDRPNLMLGNRHRQAFAESEALAGLCASRHSRVAAVAAGESRIVEAMLAGGNCFSLLGVPAMAGRMIAEADDRRGAENVAVLSYGYWQRQFGADPGVIGQPITLQDKPFTIVGIAPKGFIGLEPGAPVDVIASLSSLGGQLLDIPDVQWLRLLGRLKPGVSIAQAQADLTVRYERLPRNARQTGPLSRLELVSAPSGFGDLRSEFGLPLRILMGAVGLVLLIACMNLASLLLARGSGRRQEIHLRIALGAGRGRILRQLLTESLLLSGIGGLLALVVARVSGPLLVQFMSRGRSPIALDLAIDWRALAFTAVVALATGILFGIVPAARAVRQRGVLVAQHGSRLKAGPRGWSGALLVAQVALCVVVLVSAGLLLSSLRKLQRVDAGFRKEGLIALGIRTGNYKGAAADRLHRDLVQRFSALPGVTSVSTFADVPLGGANVTTNDFSINQVGPGFFEAMGIALLSGRAINEQDAIERHRVAVVSESVARKLFPGRDPLGLELDVMGTKREVIGVVKDARYRSLRLPADPMVYEPAFGGGSYVIRTTGDAATLVGAVRREVREAARDVAIWSLDSFDERVDGTLARERMVSLLSAWLGGFALLIASIGLYGRLAYAVSERRGEIGVRMALGARQGQVVWMVLRGALALTLAGIAIGAPIALLASRAFGALLFDVRPTDPMTFAVIFAGIVCVTSAAALLPARRAASIDPSTALRSE